ncbi:MAG: anti-sigma factor [Balneolaceae bacterium]
MDVKAYIESGILEQYVAGVLSDEENLEVDRVAGLHPEIKQEIDALRASLNNYARQSGRMPSSKILENVRSQIRSGERPDESEEEVNKNAEAPSLVRQKPKRFSTFKLAASILILISVGTNGYLISELNTARNQNEEIESKVEELNDEFSFVTNISNIKIPLNGLAVSPESHADVYINQNTRDVYIKVGNLPEPPSGHQYQLWADRDGHMHSIGVFHHNNEIQHLSVFEGGFESLNVTLEVEGGSEIATVENAYLTGKI